MAAARFPMVSCSQCGKDIGPGNHGYSHCSDHAPAPDEPAVDQYGNPIDGDRVIYCCFPDCGCDGARLCQAENGASRSACWVNIESGSPVPWRTE
jgi:hypothetical protein